MASVYAAPPSAGAGPAPDSVETNPVADPPVAEFTKLWVGQSISLFGTQVSALALPLLAVATLNASAGEMGLLSALGQLPFLLFALFAGVWVDRVRRRPLMMLADFGRAALIAAGAAAALFGWLRLEHTYVIAFIVGSLSVIFSVAYPAFVPTLVGRERLVDANSKLEMSVSGVRLVGPGAAGALIEWLSAPVAIMLDAASFLVSALCLVAIRVPEPKPKPTPVAASSNVRHDIAEGIRHTFDQPILRRLMLGNGFSNACDSLMGAVMMLWLTREIGLGPAAIGFILMTRGPGAMLGAAIAGPLAQRFGIGPTLIGSAGLIGLGSATLIAAGEFRDLATPILIVAVVVSGLGSPIYNVTVSSLRQAITPNAVLGRVSATSRFITMGAMPIGALIGGALGELIGVWPTMVVGAVGYVLWFGWLGWSPIRRVTTVESLGSAV